MGNWKLVRQRGLGGFPHERLQTRRGIGNWYLEIGNREQDAPTTNGL